MSHNIVETANTAFDPLAAKSLETNLRTAQFYATQSMIVIGRYPHYLEVAERLKAQVFNIPQDQWLAMSAEERWAINQQFLNDAMATNQQIILATPPEKVPLGSTLEKELDYLAGYGFFPKEVGDYWEVSR